MKRIFFAALLAMVGLSGAYAGTTYFTGVNQTPVYCTNSADISCAALDSVDPLFTEDGEPVSAGDLADTKFFD